ncbi:hypothetical protein M0R01_03695 [bacterium]|nr:hypothetical protein [bacterium]
MENKTIDKYLLKYKETLDESYKNALITEIYFMAKRFVRVLKTRKNYSNMDSNELINVAIIRAMEIINNTGSDLYKVESKSGYIMGIIKNSMKEYVRSLKDNREYNIDDLESPDYFIAINRKNIAIEIKDKHEIKQRASLILKAIKSFRVPHYINIGMDLDKTVKIIDEAVDKIKKNYYIIIRDERRFKMKVNLEYKIRKEQKQFIVSYYNYLLKKHVEQYQLLDN